MLIAWLWASPDGAEGQRVADRLRTVVPPDEALVQPTRWTAWQSQADGLFPRGVRAYWKNTSFDRLDEATIAVIVDRAHEQTWRGTAFDIHHLGGAFERVPLADTPFPNRSARYWLNIYGFWPDPASDADRIAFVRGFAADMEPLSSSGRYVNFLGAEDDRADPRAEALAVFGPDKLRRLADVKRRYDPDNVFRLNHNIPPG
jgi:FAD/FMN-containing dehydrogenase